MKDLWGCNENFMEILWKCNGNIMGKVVNGNVMRITRNVMGSCWVGVGAELG